MTQPVNNDDSGLQTHQIGGSNFRFSATQIGDLGATSYTLVTIAIDVSGSVYYFASELRAALVSAIESCKKSPRKENLLVRVVEFSTARNQEPIRELHGFIPVLDIDTNSYKEFAPNGYTPLYDAAHTCIAATGEYAKKLGEDDFGANAIVFLIGDGMEEAGPGGSGSTATPKMIADKVRELRGSEELESIVTVMVGVNTVDAHVANRLAAFVRDAELTHYVDSGEATPEKLAKVAEFVSQSISSQSQALGTGGPSQIVPVI